MTTQKNTSLADKPIAVVKLGPGVVSFYDELSNVYMTLDNPYAKIYPYYKKDILRRALYYNTIILMAGSLNDPPENYPNIVPNQKKEEDLEKERQKAIEKEKQEALEKKKQEAIEKAKQEAIEKEKQEALEKAKQEAEKEKQEEPVVENNTEAPKKKEKKATKKAEEKEE